MNNHLDNLRWGTPKNNSEDALRNGVNGQAKKTHCPRDHEYTPENTYIQRSIWKGKVRIARRCNTCHREKESERRKRDLR